ncbi:hypothetical protein ONZ43_g2255 [Nemania bipapillata]|uniref:Uncharacterized protein n=1 Tax=Nemania bipapillata TaxID=110536 RepID=A0ACC2J1A9_9PEZI|nr:hypothetical protein ONZ43_g2255 [Nemania bipapillata]
MYFMHLSEADFHQIIAEAIHREREGAKGLAVLSTGLRPVEAGAADPPVWADNPRFAAFLMHEAKGEDGRMIGQECELVANGVSISDMFQRCVTQREVEEVVKGGLAARLRRALQLTTADDDHLMSMRSNEVGIDSLRGRHPFMVSQDLRGRRAGAEDHG